MTTAAEVDAAFNSIPTVNFTESVVILVDGYEYDGQVLLNFADGSRTIAYTRADGTVTVRRFRKS